MSNFVSIKTTLTSLEYNLYAAFLWLPKIDLISLANHNI